MTNTYKIALATAVLLCLTLLGYYAMRNSNTTSITAQEASRPFLDESQKSEASSLVTPATLTTNGHATQSTSPDANRQNATDLNDLLAAAKAHVVGQTANVSTGQPTDPNTFLGRDQTTTANKPASIATLPLKPTILVFDNTPSKTSDTKKTLQSASSNQAASTQTSLPKQAAPTTTSRPTTYTIRPGDTLSSIAIHLYGNEHRWAQIAQANPLIDPIRLKVGQVIQLPSAIALLKAKRNTEKPLPLPNNRRSYTVHSGDTLSTISAKMYGNTKKWRLIYNANRRVIGNNPDRVQAGVKLSIPPDISSANK